MKVATSMERRQGCNTVNNVGNKDDGKFVLGLLSCFMMPELTNFYDAISMLDGEDTLHPPLSRRERLKKSRLAATAMTETSVSQRVDTAVEAFFNQEFDARRELQDQRQRKHQGTSDIDWKKVDENHTLYISSKFDLAEWWKSVGRGLHRLVFLVAPPIIALPSNNGLQERIFSTCTWFDDPLRQRLKNSRFEMAVILAANKALLTCKVPSEEEARALVEEVIATFEQESANCQEECLEEAQEFVDAVGII